MSNNQRNTRKKTKLIAALARLRFTYHHITGVPDLGRMYPRGTFAYLKGYIYG